MPNTLPSSPTSVVHRLSNAFDRHDPRLLQDLLADDCVLYTTNPAPLGGEVRGGLNCRAHWGALMAEESIRFDIEDEIADGETVVQRWRCTDASGTVVQRGVNIFTVSDGLITSAHGYVKAGR